MKKYTNVFLIFLLCVLILILVSCGRTNKTGDNTVRVEDIKNKTMNMSEVIFKEKEDNQAYFNIYSHPAAVGEHGYYYMFRAGYDKLLTHIDVETGECIPVCNQPQCSHDNTKCPAVFEGYIDEMYCYDGKLYFIKYSNEGKAILVQTKIDGTDRKELFEIGSAPEDKVRLYNLAFYDNYVYIYSSSGNCTHTFDGSMQISIRKRSLDGKEDTKIITSDEENSIFDALKVYGGNLFFVYTHTAFNKETRKNETTSEGLFCYNSYTGKVGKIIDKRISDCTVDEENRVLYYYVINEGLYKYEFDTGVDKLIYKADRNTALCQVSYDGKYIYLDNGRWYIFTRDNDLSAKIWVLDSYGKELNVIDNAGISPSYFGDSESLFSEYGALLGNRVDLDEKDTGIRYILKSDITTTKDWKKVMWR